MPKPCVWFRPVSFDHTDNIERYRSLSRLVTWYLILIKRVVFSTYYTLPYCLIKIAPECS